MSADEFTLDVRLGPPLASAGGSETPSNPWAGIPPTYSSRTVFNTPPTGTAWKPPSEPTSVGLNTDTANTAGRAGGC